VIAVDGCLMRGISHEAIRPLQAVNKLSKLIVMLNNNGHHYRRPVSLSTQVDQVARFKAGKTGTVIEDRRPQSDEIDAP